MEYANKIESPVVVLYGDSEKTSGNVILKNMKTGNEVIIKKENLVNEIKKLL